MGNRSVSAATEGVEFVTGEELGRGAYGRVFKAKYRGSVCAAKEVHSILIQLTQMAPEERKRLQEENVITVVASTIPISYILLEYIILLNSYFR